MENHTHIHVHPTTVSEELAQPTMAAWFRIWLQGLEDAWRHAGSLERLNGSLNAQLGAAGAREIALNEQLKTANQRAEAAEAQNQSDAALIQAQQASIEHRDDALAEKDRQLEVKSGEVTAANARAQEAENKLETEKKKSGNRRAIIGWGTLLALLALLLLMLPWLIGWWNNNFCPPAAPTAQVAQPTAQPTPTPVLTATKVVTPVTVFVHQPVLIGSATIQQGRGNVSNSNDSDDNISATNGGTNIVTQIEHVEHLTINPTVPTTITEELAELRRDSDRHQQDLDHIHREADGRHINEFTGAPQSWPLTGAIQYFPAEMELEAGNTLLYHTDPRSVFIIENGSETQPQSGIYWVSRLIVNNCTQLVVRIELSATPVANYIVDPQGPC